MNQKEYNHLISNISEFTGSYTQVIYQIIILVILYNLFNNISFKNVSKHKSFILLVSIIVLVIDWFIWQNKLQTVLFASVLFIYISYNTYLKTNMENYITTINDCKNISEHNRKIATQRREMLARIHDEDEQKIKDMTYSPP